MNKKSFNGPLFIVGLSRSGTKLLRDLLNNHSMIHLPTTETKIIPKILYKYKDYDIESIFNYYKLSLFYKREGVDGLKKILVEQNVRKASDFIEVMLKYHGYKDYDLWNKNMIWGDKTPNYLRYPGLLKKNFPYMKIIHIIRDPRDRVLSANKAWSNSILRAADNWRLEVKNFDNWKNKEVNKDNSYEIYYESLLKQPVKNLKAICDYLGIEYEPGMEELKRPSEAGGSKRIVSDNIEKYKKKDKKIVKKIEEIVYKEAGKKGYEMEYADRYKKLPFIKLNILRAYDYIIYKLNNK